MTKVETPHDVLTYRIIGLAMDIHNELGPGFTEDIYQRAMSVALTQEQVMFEREFPVQIIYKQQSLGEYRLDFVVEKTVILEFKALAALTKIHEQQVISYLTASGLPLGLLINFGASRLDHKRIFLPRSVQSSDAYQARLSSVK